MTRWDAAWVLLTAPGLVIAAAVFVGMCIGVGVDAWLEHHR